VTGAVLSDHFGNFVCKIFDGCCGTTPDHIKAIADKIKKRETRKKNHYTPLQTVSWRAGTH
jgi:hypothetical protein